MITVLPTYLNAYLTGESIDIGAASLKIVLVTSAHTPALTDGGDAFLSDIAAADRVMMTEAFSATVTGTNVSPDVASVNLVDEDNGRTSAQAYLLIDTGTEATSRLLVHDDGAGANDIELTSDGTNDTLDFDGQGLFGLVGAA